MLFFLAFQKVISSYKKFATLSNNPLANVKLQRFFACFNQVGGSVQNGLKIRATPTHQSKGELIIIERKKKHPHIAVPKVHKVQKVIISIHLRVRQ